MTARIWIDVEDLFIYAAAGHRPSGIQRLEFELCRALVGIRPDRVFFVRHAQGQRLRAIRWEDVEALFDEMSSREPKKASEDSPPAPIKRRHSIKKILASLVPRRIRKLVRKRLDALQAPLAADVLPAGDFAARPGDILAVFGSPWISADYHSYIDQAVSERGLRFALLVYDIIPLRRPEWVDPGNVIAFRKWFDGALLRADTIFTISAATAADVTAYARSEKLRIRSAPTPIPIGTGFTTVRNQSAANAVPMRRSLPPDSYAMIVSTIEARKNHALLMRVWRRLLDDIPAASVPTLVFAGRVGWLVSDLMQQLHNCDFLNGKIVLIDSPTDEELQALYEGCLFTLFPSFYEGWGLPVTESHAFGRPCIASKSTSVPEAGGALASYIDPDNTTEAYRVIRATIEDRAGLQQWRERVRREFRPVAWRVSARAVLQLLDGEEESTTTTSLEASSPQ